MTGLQRIKEFLAGLLFILLGAMMIMWPEYGIKFIGGMLSLLLFIMGVRALRFYFTMARHMVDGKRQLYRGVILFDLSMFTLSLNTISSVYIILYLLAIHAFAGVIDVLNAFQSKGLDDPTWKWRLVHGTVNLAMAVTAVVFGIIKDDTNIVVLIYALGLISSGFARIGGALRKTAIVYIQ